MMRTRETHRVHQGETPVTYRVEARWPSGASHAIPARNAQEALQFARRMIEHEMLDVRILVNGVPYDVEQFGRATLSP